MRLFAATTLVAAGIAAAAGSGLHRASCPADFEVRIAGSPPDAPSVSGACVVENGKPKFKPAFPFVPGVTYSVRAGGREVEQLGTERTRPAPSVTGRVYPTTDLLPANQLKLYLVSAPMMLNESARRMRLLDNDGAEVRDAFLVLDEELWDGDRRRLTVLFEPGRVKRGLRANVQAGAPLQPGEVYTLVIDREWPDAHGAPMIAGITKRFRVGPPDREWPDAATWLAHYPPTDTRAPLSVAFGETMDYAVTLNSIRVIDDRGRPLEGSATLTSGEHEWRFTPVAPWRAEPHTLMIDGRIEDLAGNNLRRLFDRDLRKPAAATDAVVRLSFTPHWSRTTTAGFE